MYVYVYVLCLSVSWLNVNAYVNIYIVVATVFAEVILYICPKSYSLLIYIKKIIKK